MMYIFKGTLRPPCWNGVKVPRWRQEGEPGNYGSGLQRNEGGMDREAEVGMLRAGPGWILKELIIGFANGFREGMKERSQQQLQHLDLSK